jgi:hypothetical protein
MCYFDCGSDSLQQWRKQMTYGIISVLTFKSVETILETGGTQSWALQRSRARSCKYAVLCRNAKTRDAEGPESHGTAFMVGRIKDVVPSTDTPGRWLILFDEYALCDVSDQWEGRNPVAYYGPKDYPMIDFSKLDFKPVPDAMRPTIASTGLTIAAAKAGLAKHYSVPESSIDITIRG